MTKGLIVHEWIARRGGSENVLDSMAAAFPEADLLCLWDDTHGERYPNRHIEETWLARSWLRNSKSFSLPAMPPVWRNRRDNDYDWVLVSSHLFAHHVSLRTRNNVPKIAYVHTPARYIWSPEYDPRGRSLAVRAVAPFFKPIDRRRAQEPDLLIANSRFVRERIRASWDRDATVIYPPVDVAQILDVGEWADQLTEGEREALESLPDQFILGASRLVEYKRLDLVIEAAAIAGIPAVIAGAGPLEAKLHEQGRAARVPVTFVGAPSTPMLYALYQRAAVFMFPPIEDFGIMPVEAMATGTPVVVSPIGGAQEAVRDIGAGVVAESHSADGFASAVVDAIDFPRTDLRQRMLKYDSSTFEQSLVSVIAEATSLA